MRDWIDRWEEVFLGLFRGMGCEKNTDVVFIVVQIMSWKIKKFAGGTSTKVKAGTNTSHKDWAIDQMVPVPPGNF